MFPNSPFNHPVGSFQTPVSIPGADPDTGDIVGVYFNKAWLPYIVGALEQLLLQSTWKVANDTELDITQGQAFDLLYLFSIAAPVPPHGVVGLLEDIAVPIRVDCNCNAFVECCDGTEKQIAYVGDIANPSQPGGGQPQPSAGGGCQSYSGKFNANSQWYIPTIVNSGDTITINSADGAGQGGAIATWKCVNGLLYFAGTCTSTTETDSGDPAPSLPHGQLIANIGGTWHSAKPGDVITVPGGIVNQPVLLQANFPLSGASGSYSVFLTVCNNQPGTWSYTANFNVGTAGWVPNSGHDALWNTGYGWVPNNSAAGWTVEIQFSALHSSNVGTVHMSYLFNGTTGLGRVEIYAGATTMFTTGTGIASSSPQSVDSTVAAAVSPGDMFTLYVSSNNSGDVDVEAIFRVTFTGTGTNPFV